MYGVLMIILGGGLTGSLDISETKEIVNEVLGSEANNLVSSTALFGILVSSGTNPGNEVASIYQTVIFIVTSLATIWGLRQVQAKTKARVRVKEAFYKGMTPLVPAVLILSLIGAQLLIIAVASSIYYNVIVQGLAVSGAEQILWTALVVLLVLLTLYLLSSSLFAFYIVTLPNMKPMQSLRTAKKLVEHRRFVVMRKILVLPLFLLIFIGVIVIPVIAFVPALAQLVFFVFTIGILPFVHSYMYTLYRELL